MALPLSNDAAQPLAEVVARARAGPSTLCAAPVQVRRRHPGGVGELAIDLPYRALLAIGHESRLIVRIDDGREADVPAVVRIELHLAHRDGKCFRIDSPQHRRGVARNDCLAVRAY